MNTKLRSILSLSMMLGMSGNIIHEENGGTNRMESRLPQNNDQKCIRPGCGRQRNGNRGYCSAMCCGMDKQRVKQLNKTR